MSNDSCFGTVIVGVDGASGGRDAFELVLRLAPDAERLILVAVDLSDPVGPEIDRGVNRTDAALQAAEFSQSASATGPEILVQVLRAGTVADGLVDKARRCAADLIVVGCSQRGPIMRVLLGDDTRAVLHRAPCPVAVAPRGFAEHPPDAITTIGVGYDGDGDGASERAVDIARKLEPPDGSLRLTQVVFPSPSSMKRLPYGITPEDRERLAALEDFDERGVTFGSVRYGLLELAQRVDLLVIGLHQKAWFDQLVHRSTADELLHELPCALLAVPDPLPKIPG